MVNHPESLNWLLSLVGEVRCHNRSIDVNYFKLLLVQSLCSNSVVIYLLPLLSCTSVRTGVL